MVRAVGFSDRVFAAYPDARCHYCNIKLLHAKSPEGLANLDLIATRDHTLAKSQGGNEWVPACRQCNMLKKDDPYDLFLTFMECEGRELHRHERKAAYIWFKNQMIKLGLSFFNDERERLAKEGSSTRFPE